MQPTLNRIDHIHVFVSDRDAAVRWYEEVMGLRPLPEFRFWADDGGPLTIANVSGSVHLALFERPVQQACHSTVALGVGALTFLAWRHHLGLVLGKPVEAVDHQLSWSLYFSDPDGNPYEITSYEYGVLSEALRPR